MTTVTMIAPDGFASAVHLSRRSRGLSLAGLSASSGVPEADLRDLETGGVMSPDHRAALCRALAIDPVRNVTGNPNGPVAAPKPSDEASARVMADLAAAAAGRGWLLHPDVAGWEEDRDPDDAVTTARAHQARARMIEASKVRIVVNLSALAMVAVAVAVWGAQNALLATFAIVAPIVGVANIGVDRRDQAGAEALRDWQARRRDDMGRRAYVVSLEALLVLTHTPDGVAVREHLASSIHGVQVRDVSGRHVTVEVTTSEGLVTIPWVTRSPHLFDVISRWVDRRE